MIQITVSNNYYNDKLNNLLLLNDTSINETILDLGTLSYYNQINLLNNINTDIELNKKNIEIDILKNDINKLKYDNTFNITSLIDKGKDIEKKNNDIFIDLLQSNIIDIKKTYENQINNLNNNIQDLNNKLIELYTTNDNNNYNSIHNNINILQNKMSNYFDKIFKGNTEKGIFGENFIQSFLIDKFTNSKIIDTHKETSKGDLFFYFDNLKTLIESKNVQTLKKDDIDKFYRDIENCSSKNEINSALLISLHDSNLINGNRHFFFEIKNNIPIIMISNVFNNTEFIRFSILILNYLINNGFSNNDNDDNKISFIITSLNEIFNIFQNQYSYLENDKSLILKLQDSFKKRYNDLFNIDKLFNNIFSKYSILNNNIYLQDSNIDSNISITNSTVSDIVTNTDSNNMNIKITSKRSNSNNQILL